ncbi:hypothetical protein DPX16_0942 [Anabarilius grahami]|uniref:Uncharacterized protein n=1 Tax=Anabarilius grahami TaxID=495550 RepID=A0A3N0XLT8_ANAGA|nr:hypothetical protein DPX16_0942 [Anabarilius grahami]
MTKAFQRKDVSQNAVAQLVPIGELYFPGEINEPVVRKPAKRGGASGYISRHSGIGSSDQFSFSDDDLLFADTETTDACLPLTCLAADSAETRRPASTQCLQSQLAFALLASCLDTCKQTDQCFPCRHPASV